MKKFTFLSSAILMMLFLSSCYTEVILEDVFIEDTPLQTRQVLEAYDLWYVDIQSTQGYGEVPFLQRAFTISFVNGLFYANNNISGIGKTGNGLGIRVGYYDAVAGVLEIDHDVDGIWTLEVIGVNSRTLELYDRRSNTSYYLDGYQRSNFDYDRLFYENIELLLQEYDVWEKTYVSDTGFANEFDEENFLQFFEGNSGTRFRSSVDALGTPLSNIVWDYEGFYEIYNVENDETLKTLTLDYAFMGNDYFELYVIDDRTIELYHPDSQTVYEFQGRGYIQYLKSDSAAKSRKRVKSNHPTMKVKRQRK
ncbi:MAG: nicotinic acid mononucleotide adenyltransferase [Flavobacteriaceae bacterium]|nr:nicotinic acid mononucleotide adenyltransferase [Muriicola sp.]NNC61767.1 nicotinic acid mononucleotide adenyltransferase [Eudoraea sp.]NNK21297.1 nicotinic acid mononucleotide adenyltransferase [Flavobacteriaceae bacterium]MBT8290767.1 nicotinic acid mononucleotide adenyltransferase [Muriicola sp.]NNK35966.1 nicotinic acid mononucleotide adenyltransferase [Eudoraea sp.]